MMKEDKSKEQFRIQTVTVLLYVPLKKKMKTNSENLNHNN